MNIYVINTNLERVAVIDAYSSIIWNNRYYEPGEFELYLQARQDYIDTLKQDYYLIREDDESNAMIIEAIETQTDAEEGNYLIVKGRCLKSLVYRRVIWEQTTLYGQVETCIERIVNENIISPKEENRKISNFTIGDMVTTGEIMTAQYTGNNLGETITAICQTYGIGWRVDLDLERKKFIFVLFAGIDRSYRQDLRPWVVFSNDYENLLTSIYTFDKSAYSNVARVAGEGEGVERRVVTVGDVSGLERREIFIDARDISSNEGEMSDKEYFAQLTQRGVEKLSETTETRNFEGETVDYTYKYGEDYYLGDIVEVVNEYGMKAATRVLEVIQSEDDSGKYTIPTFSDYLESEV